MYWFTKRRPRGAIEKSSKLGSFGVDFCSQCVCESVVESNYNDGLRILDPIVRLEGRETEEHAGVTFVAHTIASTVPVLVFCSLCYALHCATLVSSR